MAANLSIKITAADSASAVFGQVSQAAEGFGSRLTDGIGRAVSGTVGAFGAFGLAVNGVQAALDGVKGVGSLMGVSALSEMEQTRASFMAFTKDAGKTEEILAQVRSEAAKTPFAFGEMAKATASLLPVSKSSGQGLMDLVQQAEILAASNPMEGLEGASFSLREAMTGDFTSIIERFNLSRSSINQWKAEGVSNFEIVRRAMAEMGFDSDLIAAKAETLEGRWSTFQDTLTTLQMKMGEPIFNALKEGLVGLQGALDGNMPALEAFADTVANGIGAAIAFVKDAFATLGPIVADAWATVQQVFEGNWSPDQSINPIVNAIGMIATVIRDVVLPAVSAFGSFVVEIFGEVVGWFQENMPLIQKTIAVVLAAISVLWETHGAAILTVVRSAWTIVSTVIGTAVRNLLDVVKLGMQLITGDWEGAWGTIGDILDRTWAAYGTIIGAAWDAIFAIVDTATGGLLTQIGNWMSETGTAIGTGMQLQVDAIQTGWDNVNSLVGSILPTIRSAILAIWNLLPEDIRTDLALIATHIVTQGATWVTNLTTAGSNMLTAITGKLGEMVTAATTWATSTFLAPINGLVGTATTAATNVGGGILSSITGKLGEVVSAVTTWADSTFLAPLRGLISTASGIASSIGQGIIDGIRGAIQRGASSVTEALLGMARSGLQAVKESLGIHSPSEKWWKEVGAPIGQGVIGGLLSQAPAFMQAVTSMLQPAQVMVGATLTAMGQQATAMAEAARQAAMAASKAKNLRDISDIVGDFGRFMKAGSETARVPLFSPWVKPISDLPDPIFRPRSSDSGSTQTVEHVIRVGDLEAMRIVVVGRELASSVYGGNNF